MYCVYGISVVVKLHVTQKVVWDSPLQVLPGDYKQLQ